MHADLGDLYEATLVRKGRLRPGESEHVDGLFETRLSMIRRMSESLALLEKPAGADAELEASFRKQIDRCGLLGQRDRIGRDQRPDRHAKPHALRRRGEQSQR